MSDTGTDRDLKPLDLSANALAKALRLSPSRIGDIEARAAREHAAA
jgi:hypothetical protein